MDITITLKGISKEKIPRVKNQIKPLASFAKITIESQDGNKKKKLSLKPGED